MPNSPALAEGEGVTATFLGLPGRGGTNCPVKLIRRAPSVDGVTATFLGNLILTKKNN